jgi:hypothetical protein
MLTRAPIGCIGCSSGEELERRGSKASLSSRVRRGSSPDKRIQGTPDYLSPELLLGIGNGVRQYICC